MNFFDHQQRARSQSRRLILVFAGAVLLTVAAIVGLLVLVLANSDEPPQGGDWLPIIGISSAVVLAVIGLASLWRIASLSQGGGALARALGAVQVSADTQVPRLRRLRNVVEEMSIASGVPAPEIYLLEREAGINAFAAGFSPADAAVCVTSGALDNLSREELQGVIAHEFSHVLNGDMRINLRLLGWLFGLLMLGVIGRHMMQARSGEKEGMAIAMGGVAIWLIGSLGLLFGRLIKASISRKREFLADASAVQFTRQTSGLVGALKKAAALPAGTRLTAGEGEEVAHMLFGDGVGYGAMFATHPPLSERIRRLDPTFDPQELQRLGALIGNGRLETRDDFEGALGVAQLLTPADSNVRLEPQQVADLVGQAYDPHLIQARQIRRQLSPVLKLAARSVEHAPALLFALLLDPRQEALRQQQRRTIGEQQGQALVHRCMELFVVLQNEQIDERLPLAQMCFPTLKRRPAADLRGIVDTVHALVHVDGEVAVFEYCLATMLEHLLHDAESPNRAGQPGRLVLRQALPQIHDLLAVVAVLGGNASATAAYAAGAEQISGLSPELPDVADWRASLDRCWPVLDQLDPQAKPVLIAALTATLLHDGVLSVAEGELLRTICASLHCPLPPLIESLPES